MQLLKFQRYFLNEYQNYLIRRTCNVHVYVCHIIYILSMYIKRVCDHKNENICRFMYLKTKKKNS